MKKITTLITLLSLLHAPLVMSMQPSRKTPYTQVIIEKDTFDREFSYLFSEVFQDNKKIFVKLMNKTIINKNDFEKFEKFLTTKAQEFIAQNNDQVKELVIRLKKKFLTYFTFKPVTTKHLDITIKNETELKNFMKRLKFIRTQAFYEQRKTNKCNLALFTAFSIFWIIVMAIVITVCHIIRHHDSDSSFWLLFLYWILAFVPATTIGLSCACCCIVGNFLQVNTNQHFFRYIFENFSNHKTQT